MFQHRDFVLLPLHKLFLDRSCINIQRFSSIESCPTKIGRSGGSSTFFICWIPTWEHRINMKLMENDVKSKWWVLEKKNWWSEFQKKFFFFTESTPNFSVFFTNISFFWIASLSTSHIIERFQISTKKINQFKRYSAFILWKILKKLA